MNLSQGIPVEVVPEVLLSSCTTSTTAQIRWVGTEQREFTWESSTSQEIPGSSKLKVGCVLLKPSGEESPCHSRGAPAEFLPGFAASNLDRFLLLLSSCALISCAPKGTLGTSPSPVQRAQFSSCSFKLSLMSLMWFPDQLTPTQLRARQYRPHAALETLFPD